MKQRKNFQFQTGFTLVEIIVSTGIFVMVVSSMLTLFNQTLQINRRVQTLRELVQGTRTFTETLSREIRNGRIEYDSPIAECRDLGIEKYTQSDNKYLGIITRTGDHLCFYMDRNGDFSLKKLSTTGESSEAVFSTDRFRIVNDTFRFHVYPQTDPNPDSGPHPAIQPFVTIVAQFQLDSLGDASSSTINYQTTISTDVYDIFRKN